MKALQDILEGPAAAAAVKLLVQPPELLVKDLPAVLDLIV
jgi:hypothetical protein